MRSWRRVACRAEDAECLHLRAPRETRSSRLTMSFSTRCRQSWGVGRDSQHSHVSFTLWAAISTASCKEQNVFTGRITCIDAASQDAARLDKNSMSCCLASIIYNLLSYSGGAVPVSKHPLFKTCRPAPGSSQDPSESQRAHPGPWG